jgi:hypothetical protein
MSEKPQADELTRTTTEEIKSWLSSQAGDLDASDENILHLALNDLELVKVVNNPIMDDPGEEPLPEDEWNPVRVWTWLDELDIESQPVIDAIDEAMAEYGFVNVLTTGQTEMQYSHESHYTEEELAEFREDDDEDEDDSPGVTVSIGALPSPFDDDTDVAYACDECFDRFDTVHGAKTHKGIVHTDDDDSDQDNDSTEIAVEDADDDSDTTVTTDGGQQMNETERQPQPEQEAEKLENRYTGVENARVTRGDTGLVQDLTITVKFSQEHIPRHVQHNMMVSGYFVSEIRRHDEFDSLHDVAMTVTYRRVADL